jgi:hypothetical protein
MKRGHDIHVCGDGGDVTTCTRRRVELLGGGAQGGGGWCNAGGLGCPYPPHQRVRVELRRWVDS